MHCAMPYELIRILHLYSVHDPCLLLSGPENRNALGLYVLSHYDSVGLLIRPSSSW